MLDKNISRRDQTRVKAASHGARVKHGDSGGVELG